MTRRRGPALVRTSQFLLKVCQAGADRGGRGTKTKELGRVIWCAHGADRPVDASLDHRRLPIHQRRPLSDGSADAPERLPAYLGPLHAFHTRSVWPAGDRSSRIANTRSVDGELAALHMQHALSAVREDGPAFGKEEGKPSSTARDLLCCRV